MDWSPDTRLRRRMAVALGSTLVGYGVLLGPLFLVLPVDLALVVSATVLGCVVAVALHADRLVDLVTAQVAIDREDYPALFDTLDRLAAQADVRPPRVVIVPGYEPNAFSAGIGNRAVVCVTVGLLEDLDGDELEAVLAHELAHVSNGDSAVLTVAGFPATVAVALLSVATRYFDGWAYLFGYVVALVFAMLVAVPLLVASLPGTLLLSRYREYAADRGAVALTGNPLALASALETLTGESGGDAPDTDLRRLAGFNAFCIAPTPYSSLSLPSTHPPTHERVRRLREMAAELEAA